MNLLTAANPLVLWQDVVREAEEACDVSLENKLEFYLADLLGRYVDKPELTKHVFATTLLEAMSLHEASRNIRLKQVGDRCLLYAGLFPASAQRKHVKISYFVDLGRSAYANISDSTSDLFGSLALQFVLLMDVLQTVRQSDLLPLEAYEQWKLVGSERALRILQSYTKIVPFKK